MGRFNEHVLMKELNGELSFIDRVAEKRPDLPYEEVIKELFGDPYYEEQ